MKFNDVAIVSVEGNDFRIYFWHMNEYDATNIIKNSDLNEKSELMREYGRNRHQNAWRE